MSAELKEYAGETRLIVVEIEAGVLFWTLARSFNDALRVVEGLLPGELIAMEETIHAWVVGGDKLHVFYFDHRPPEWVPEAWVTDNGEEVWGTATAASWANAYPDAGPFLIADTDS